MDFRRRSASSTCTSPARTSSRPGQRAPPLYASRPRSAGLKSPDPPSRRCRTRRSGSFCRLRESQAPGSPGQATCCLSEPTFRRVRFRPVLGRPGLTRAFRPVEVRALAVLGSRAGPPRRSTHGALANLVAAVALDSPGGATNLTLPRVAVRWMRLDLDRARTCRRRGPQRSFRPLYYEHRIRSPGPRFE